MKRRRVAKWSGLLACVTIAAAWLFSTFWQASYQTHSWDCVALHGGVVQWEPLWPELAPMDFTPLGIAEFNANSEHWRCYGPVFVGTHGGVIVPLWAPLAILAAFTTVLWWRDRRRVQPGHCRCGYDLTGN